MSYTAELRILRRANTRTLHKPSSYNKHGNI